MGLIRCSAGMGRISREGLQEDRLGLVVAGMGCWKCVKVPHIPFYLGHYLDGNILSGVLITLP